MPSARHWRLSFHMAATGSSVAVREIAFLDAIGADLSVGGTATASSSNGANTPDRAFDKSTATNWSPVSSETLATISYDHGADVDVAQVTVNLGSLGALPAVDSSIRWMTSSDGTTWSLPQVLRLVSGSITTNTAATYDLVEIGDTTFQGFDDSFVPFAGSALPDGMPTISFPDSIAPYRDFEFGGVGQVLGTVKRDADPVDLPLRRRVRLHREQDGMLIRETWSDATTGAYAFTEIDASTIYTVIAYDHLHDYRAVIADNITPELMP